jgi:hypothetical protein
VQRTRNSNLAASADARRVSVFEGRVTVGAPLSSDVWRVAMRFLFLLTTPAMLVGCRTNSARTADQFAFLEVGIPLTFVTNRVGMPDLCPRGQIRLQYKLADGSEMVIVSDGGEIREDWRVAWFGQRRGTNWLWAKPPEVLK